MGTTHRRWSAPARAAILVTLAILVLLVSAASASATPPDPTLSLDEVRARLESGPLSGYLKTVVRGYTVEQIPVTVEGTVDYSWGSLILFTASGPVIDKIGGVAAGMSGSPVYVDDGGVDKLIGAVSYGDVFTLGGMAMATPIEYMAALEADYPVKPPAPGIYELVEPVKTEAGVVDTVVVAKSQKAAARIDAGPGQAVMLPLTVLQIGGLAPQSRAYKELAAKLERQTGLTARPAAGAGFWAGLPAPPIEGGSSVCQLFSLGSVWFGAAGTATYVDDDVVVAFGHPSWWTGPCGAAMTAGYVSGIWPSSYAPYKMISPRDVKGTITQDRTWGIAGVVGQDPDMIPVDAHVTFPEEGREVTTDSVSAEWAFTTPGYEDMPVYLLMQALWDACDALAIPGSAETTTTVVVSDGTGTYTVTMDNLWTDAWDITWTPVADAFDAVWALSRDPDGVLDTRLESIDFEAKVSPDQRSGRFIGIALPNGLRTGDNPVEIRFYGYGSREPRTVSTTLTLPEGKPVNGEFELIPANWGYWYDESDGGASAPTTLADIVDGLNGRAKNSDLLLTFYPREGGGFRPPDDVSGPSTAPGDTGDSAYEPVAVTVPTGWVFDDWWTGSTIPVRIDARPRRADSGQRVRFSGAVMGATTDVPVAIYRTDAAHGGETYVKTVTAYYEGEVATFAFRTSVGPHHNTITARVGAVDDWLPGSDDVTVKVRAIAGLSKSVSGRRVTLTAKITPSDTGGRVTFQRKVGGRWRSFRTVGVPTSGKARITWTAPRAGSYRWRAKFLGSALNLSDVSPVRTVAVR